MYKKVLATLILKDQDPEKMITLGRSHQDFLPSRRNNQTTLLLLNNHWPDEDTINPPFFHRSKGKHVQLTLSVDKTAHAPTKLEKKSEETLLSTAAATAGMTKATNNEDLRNASKWCEIWLVPVEAGDLSTDKGWRRRNPRPPNSGERQGNDRY